jgi:inosose dehydratase
MRLKLSRREFMVGAGAVAAVTALPVPSQQGGSPLYPPTDLSYFDKPIKAPAFEVRFGYAAITWKGDDLQAIQDVAELGFKGIQLRANVLEKFGGRPQALRDLLSQHRLTMAAFSSGGVRTDPGTEEEEILKHTSNAKFVRDVGGVYLQLTDSARPKDRKPEAEDFKKLGRMLTEIGKRTLDLGIPAAYHNHMNSLGEAPDEVDRILDAADPHFVKLLLDVAHYAQGGGDPVKAVKQYHDRLPLLHIKDVESPVPGATGDLSRSYRFVELGRGKVDFPGLFEALKAVKFNGWGIVELDSVPDPARTPKESAIISKKYIEEKLRMKI